MPLQAPKLDTRDFDQLLREALLRIPRYVPEWTDFNESDPGIALVQLFAWLTEMMFYEMNRVPERNYIKFLQLLNMELRPAQPATAHLTFTAQAGAQVGASVRRRYHCPFKPGRARADASTIAETNNNCHGLRLLPPPRSIPKQQCFVTEKYGFSQFASRRLDKNGFFSIVEEPVGGLK